MDEPNLTKRSKLLACRICLNMGVVLTQLGHSGMTSFLENIFETNGYAQKLNLLNYVCLECKGLLWKCYNFVEKALKAQKKMYELMAGKKVLCAKDLLSIDRKSLGICASLGYHRVEVNFKWKYIDNQDDISIFPSNDESIIKIEDNSAHINGFTNEEDPIQTNDNEDVTIDVMIKNDDIEENEYQDLIQVTKNNEEVMYNEMIKTENIEFNEYLSGIEDFEMNDYLQKNDKVAIADDAGNILLMPLNKRKSKKRKKRIVGKRTIVRKEPRLKKYKRSIKSEGVKISTDNIITEPRNRKLNMTSYKNTECKITRKCDKDKKAAEDCDYVPGNVSSDSETTSHDSFDDNGKLMKKPKDTRDYPRECEHCNFTIEKKPDHYRHYLRSHLDIEYPYHIPATHVCQYCGKKYRKKSYLNRHELTHSDERNFKCDVCEKAFKNSTQINRHKKRHKAPLMFCDFCKKGFIERIDIRRHMRIHTGEKPFKCPLCDATFGIKANIKSHIAAHHQFLDSGTKKKTKKKTANKTKSA